MTCELRRVKNVRYIAAGDILIEVRSMHVKKIIEESKHSSDQDI